MKPVINPAKASSLVDIILWINSRGWSPATSTNYSFKNSNNPLTIAISQSGIDKSKFGTQHFMLIDSTGVPLEDFSHLKLSCIRYYIRKTRSWKLYYIPIRFTVPSYHRNICQKDSLS